PDPSGNNNGNGNGTGNGNGNGSGNGNGNGNGGSGTTLTYINDTYTTISMVANNQTQTIAPGASLVFTGTAGSSFSASASTSGKTSSGTQVGLLLSWTLSNTFPGSGNFSTKLDAGSNYFFLKIINRSSLAMTKLYVNYGLQPQTLDNITIPNDGLTYNIGYYSAYTNSNARAENGNTYWYWSTLNLPGTLNQATILTGN
ncbi:MAG TPA: hypothetical protein VL832_18710, partial [Puia sp.]|nr:hypothetical protein [Puia sp.]